MKFKDKIINHLTDYKKRTFPNIPNGKHKSLEYGHILPKLHQCKNLTEAYRDDFLESGLLCNLKLHMCFNHLNSSQAMCFNFFYPLLKEKKLELVLECLGLKNEIVDYETCYFEKESDIDGTGNRRPTNFDFYLATSSEIKIHFEIKYSEQEFGGAKDDKEHSEKYGLIYEGVSKASIKPEFANIKEFLKNYQIMRNLIHLSKNSYVVFIYPAENEKIREKAEYAKVNFVKAEYEQNVINVTWEELFTFVQDKIPDANVKLLRQMKEFKEKYII